MKKENNDCLGVQKTGVTGVQTNDLNDSDPTSGKQRTGYCLHSCNS